MAEYAVAGTLLSWGGTTIGNIQSFGGIGLTNETLDVTDISETVKSHISAKLYGAEPVTAEVFLDPALAIYTQMYADLKSGTARTLLVNMIPATATFSASAYLTQFSATGAVGGALQGSVQFQPTGTITLA